VRRRRKLKLLSRIKLDEERGLIRKIEEEVLIIRSRKEKLLVAISERESQKQVLKNWDEDRPRTAVDILMAGIRRRGVLSPRCHWFFG